MQPYCAFAPPIHVLLRREGWLVNRKRVHRLYKLKGLNLRSKRPRRHVSAHRERVPGAVAANDQWSMDFVSDALLNGKRIRALTIVDNFSRRCLAIEVDSCLRGDQVVAALERLLREHGASKCIRVDNGPEFVSKVLDRGRTATVLFSISVGQGNRSTTATSNLSMAGSATNVSTHIGFCPLARCRAGWSKWRGTQDDMLRRLLEGRSQWATSGSSVAP